MHPMHSMHLHTQTDNESQFYYILMVVIKINAFPILLLDVTVIIEHQEYKCLHRLCVYSTRNFVF